MPGPRTKSLAQPNASFANHKLTLVDVEPKRLLRISTHNTGEPYFNKSAKNRFDDPNPDSTKRYGTCYFGFKLTVAIAETLLHDLNPVGGHFLIHPDRIDERFTIHYQGSRLTLAKMVGIPLRQAGLSAELSGTSFYTKPQRWSAALYNHPSKVDGFIYMSRHLNTEQAVVLFDRAKPKIQMDTATQLSKYPGFAKAAKLLGIRGA